MADEPMQPTPSDEADRSSRELAELLKRAQKGDESALPALRKALDAGLNFLKHGDIAGEARHALLNPLAGKNLLAREQMSRQIDELAKELAGPDPSPIERLLAERAAFCRHVVFQYERQFAAFEDPSIKQVDSHQRKIDAAHRRYMAALRTLATVRKLSGPIVQLNIAERQVNVAGGDLARSPTG